MRRHWLRWAQGVLAIVVVVIVVLRLRHDWDEITAVPLSLTLRPLWLVASLAITWLMYAALVEGWRRIVTGWGQQLDYLPAARIWTIASLIALIPGRVWGIAGMAKMSERVGVRAGAAMAAAIVMQVLAIGTGVGITALAVGPTLRRLHPQIGVAMAGLGAIILVAILVVGHGGMLRWIWRLTGRDGEPPPPPGWGVLAGAVVINTVAWIGYGLAFWTLARGILPDLSMPISVAVGAFAVSYIVGYLAVFTAGGLGVREVLLSALLAPSIGIAAAAALVIASRLMLTINQVGAATPFLLTRGSSRDPT